MILVLGPVKDSPSKPAAGPDHSQPEPEASKPEPSDPGCSNGGKPDVPEPASAKAANGGTPGEADTEMDLLAAEAFHTAKTV